MIKNYHPVDKTVRLVYARTHWDSVERLDFSLAVSIGNRQTSVTQINRSMRLILAWVLRPVHYLPYNTFGVAILDYNYYFYNGQTNPPVIYCDKSYQHGCLYYTDWCTLFNWPLITGLFEKYDVETGYGSELLRTTKGVTTKSRYEKCTRSMSKSVYFRPGSQESIK